MEPLDEIKGTLAKQSDTLAELRGMLGAVLPQYGNDIKDLKDAAARHGESIQHHHGRITALEQNAQNQQRLPNWVPVAGFIITTLGLVVTIILTLMARAAS